MLQQIKAAFFAACLTSCFHVAEAQKAEVPARILLNNGSLLKANLVVGTNFYRRNRIDERSINARYITIVDSATGKRKGIESSLVSELRFKDLKGRPRDFISVDKTLNEVIYDGKVLWMRRYGTSQNGSGLVGEDYLLCEDGRKQFLFGFHHRRNGIRRAVASRPDLVRIADTMEISSQNLLMLLQKYDAE